MNRPPKKWWYSTVKKLRGMKNISDPAKAAGWLWYHRLTPKKKISLLSKKDLQRELEKYYTASGGNCSKDQDTQTQFGRGAKKMKKAKRAKKAKRTKRGKRHASQKQLAALAKGRKTLKYLRTGRKIATHKEPILIKEGRIMAGKKRHHGKKGTRKHGGEFGGEFGGKRRGRRLYGAANPIVELLTDTTGILGGAIATSFIANLIPIKNNIIKALIPIGLGTGTVLFPATAEIRIANRAGYGALAVGLFSLLRALAPKMPLLSGADTAEAIAKAIDQLPDDEKHILGLLEAPQAAGEIVAPEASGDDFQEHPVYGNEAGEIEDESAAGDEDTEGAFVTAATM
jgi:hypothetical protein